MYGASKWQFALACATFSSLIVGRMRADGTEWEKEFARSGEVSCKCRCNSETCRWVII